MRPTGRASCTNLSTDEYNVTDRVVTRCRSSYVLLDDAVDRPRIGGHHSVDIFPHLNTVMN